MKIWETDGYRKTIEGGSNMKKEIIVKCSGCEAEISFNSVELKVEGWTDMHRIVEDWKQFHRKHHKSKILVRDVK